jgi:cobalt-zinc-cadmium efflux system outer membrane protein
MTILRLHSSIVSATALALALAVAPAAQSQAPATLAFPNPVSAPIPAVIPTSPLTMQQAVDLAEAQNPTLLAAQLNLLSVKAQEITAGLRANPYLGITGQDVTNAADNPASPYAYSAQVSRLFERGEKRRWRLDTAHATTDQTRDQYFLQEQQTVLGVKQAFTNMVLAKAALELADDNLKDFRHELDINKARFDAGDIGKLDYERLDLQLAQFESDQTSAALNLKQSSYQLQTLLGLPRVTDTFDVLGDIRPPVVASNLADLEQRALTARPDYKAAQDAIRVADANLKLAFANGTTDPTLEAEYDRAATYNSFGFNINIPLRIFDRNQGNKQVTKYLAQGSRFGEIAARNQVFSDVDQAWAGYISTRGLADRYNSHYLAEAKDVLDIAQFAYEHGGLALVDYLNALQSDRTTTSAALNADAQTWLAIHQLSFATATDVAP